MNTQETSALPTSQFTATKGRKLRGRRAVAAAALMLAGIAGTGCARSGGEAVKAPATTATAAPTVNAQASPAAADSASALPAGHAQVVRSDHDLVVHTDPDNASPGRTLAGHTSFGTPLSLLVTKSANGWAQVLVPGRPTGATAWVRTDGVELRDVTTEIRVDLAARTLTLYDAGQVVLSTPVAIGSPEDPTPTGRFSVTDKLASPKAGSAYGPFALGLSGRSNVLTDFAGGDGQIGIHGTNQPDSIGQAVSHGCIRVPNDVITQLNDILPLGTPVVVA